MSGLECPVLGDFGAISGGEPTGNYPFAIAIVPAEYVENLGGGAAMFVLDGSTSFTICIQKNTIIPHMIDKRCLNIKALGFPTNIKNATAQGAIRTITSRKEDDEYSLGEAAFAEGYDTEASGYSSHAEGSGTIASGYSSHAEGCNTIASGIYSHVEGRVTEASGEHSHAEGEGTEASGNSSHAEGSSTKASGNYSHAEGYLVTASGDYSHVQGKYNVADSAGKYAHIVGNGIADAFRSNAHTLDWDGNAWFAGGIELTSPNGTRYRFTVTDDGTLSAAVVS